MGNLSQYRMNDTSFSWHDKYINDLGFNQFQAYIRDVNNALANLRPGRHYNVETSVPAEKHDLFIKICCTYILSHPDYEFSDDYTKIRRRYP